MQQILILKGLPASGKSTWAKKQTNFKRINRDDLRNMVDAGVWSPSNEKIIDEVRMTTLSILLQKGHDVIIDDTNFSDKNWDKICLLAEKVGDITVTEVYFDTPVDVCIERDKLRTSPVGEGVILDMWKRYVKGKSVSERTAYFPKIDLTVRSRDWSLPLAIIVDLDGTLCIHNGRSPYEYEKCDTDLVNAAVGYIVNIMSSHDKILLVSGREDSAREKTVNWLIAHNISFTELHMRKAGDYRDDRVVKEEIYNNSIKDKYNVSFVLDDRSKVVNMWRSIGLPCFQVAPGDF